MDIHVDEPLCLRTTKEDIIYRLYKIYYTEIDLGPHIESTLKCLPQASS